ncbi:MAG TPA: hypothetical protein VHC63_00720 [Acidimicrobiales bacterium]|nr:hypothetical protein [Acidimicrobiales bacterium]
MTKQNVTIQLDGETIREAKVLAARRGTSLSALLAAELQRLVADDERYEAARQRAEAALSNARPRGGRRWTRDAIYDRAVLNRE